MEDLPPDTLEKLARVTKLLKTQRTLPAKLEAVVAMAKRTIPNCDAAGVCLLIDGEPTSIAVSDRLAVEIDLVQYRTGEGPCLAAIGESHMVRIDVLDADTRFTHFAPGALDLELSSVLSVPLDANGRTVGALNLYSRRPDAGRTPSMPERRKRYSRWPTTQPSRSAPLRSMPTPSTSWTGWPNRSRARP